MSTVSNVIDIYDTVTDSWSTIYNQITGSISQAHVIGEKIFVITMDLSLLYDPITGTSSNRCIEHLYVYDPVNDLWTEKTSIPFPLHNGADCVSVVVDDKLMVFGEFFTGKDLTLENNKKEPKILVYDIKTNEWTEKKTMFPTENFTPQAVEITNGVYAPQLIYFFSWSPSGPFLTSIINVYDPSDNSWSTAEPMPVSMNNGYRVCAVDDVFYVIGTGVEQVGTGSGSYYKGCANLQYIPIGYHSTLPTTTRLTLNNPLIITTLTLTISTITISLIYLIHKKRHTKKNYQTIKKGNVVKMFLWSRISCRVENLYVRNIRDQDGSVGNGLFLSRDSNGLKWANPSSSLSNIKCGSGNTPQTTIQGVQTAGFVNVRFDTPFPVGTVPKVVATIKGASDPITISVNNITNVGFDVATLLVTTARHFHELGSAESTEPGNSNRTNPVTTHTHDNGVYLTFANLNKYTSTDQNHYHGYSDWYCEQEFPNTPSQRSGNTDVPNQGLPPYMRQLWFKQKITTNNGVSIDACSCGGAMTTIAGPQMTLCTDYYTPVAGEGFIGVGVAFDWIAIAQ